MCKRFRAAPGSCVNALADVRDDEEEGLAPYALIAAIRRCVPRICIARFRL